MNPNFITAYKEAVKSVSHIQGPIQKGLTELANNSEGLTNEELADTLMALKKSFELMEESYKAVKRIYKTLEGRFVERCSLQIQTDGKLSVLTTRTEWCTATCRAEIHSPVPTLEKDEKIYRALCKYMKLPQEVEDAGAVKFSWEKIAECLTKDAENGLPLPEGISSQDTFITKTVVIRQKKDLNNE